MKANLKEILESIPDYEDFMKLASEIGELSFKKLQTDNKIKAMESETFKKAMAMPLENGKFPSASYVSNAFLHTGLSGEITEQRDVLADITAQLDKKRIQLSIYRDMIGLFQTVSANERSQGF